MTDAEQREAVRQFVNRWMGKGKEDEDGRSYWIDLLSNVLGMDNVTERLNFEKKVVVDGNTKREYVKNLLRQLNHEHPGVKERMFTAILNGNLKGWTLPQ